jgi:hypothetical protein
VDSDKDQLLNRKSSQVNTATTIYKTFHRQLLQFSLTWNIPLLIYHPWYWARIVPGNPFAFPPSMEVIL